jgi:hypothetical protein
MKWILTEIVNRLADTAASLDALEAALVRNHQLRNDDIRGLFPVHKGTVEQLLASLRVAISALPEQGQA